jgi:hypothetical protein
MALNLQERANMVFQKEKEGIRHSSMINSNRRAPITSQGILVNGITFLFF